MQIKFKIPVQIDGKKFPVGIHDVPTELLNHWFLVALKSNGSAVFIEPAKPVSLVSAEVIEGGSESKASNSGDEIEGSDHSKSPQPRKRKGN